MDVPQITELETKEEFLQRVFRKGKSYEAKEQARSAINNLNYFCNSKYSKTEAEILKELSKEPTVGRVAKLLNGFVEWCGMRRNDSNY